LLKPLLTLTPPLLRPLLRLAPPLLTLTPPLLRPLLTLKPPLEVTLLPTLGLAGEEAMIAFLVAVMLLIKDRFSKLIVIPPKKFLVDFDCGAFYCSRLSVLY
jgi:hypothetical protein